MPLLITFVRICQIDVGKIEAGIEAREEASLARSLAAAKTRWTDCLTFVPVASFWADYKGGTTPAASPPPPPLPPFPTLSSLRLSVSIPSVHTP